MSSLPALARSSVEAISYTLVASLSTFTLDLHPGRVVQLAFFAVLGLYIPFRAFRLMRDRRLASTR